MATYLLDGSASARLPRRPLSVSVSVGGRNRGGVRLTARLASGAQASVRAHSPSMMIVPRVDEEIIIAAVPDAGRAHFDEDTVLHVTIGPDSHDDPDADYAQLAPREVSGLTTIELASIVPAGAEQVMVTTRLAVADTALSPLASRARVACRGALGVDALPTHQQLSLACVIDTSASMAALTAEGLVAAATDIVAGLAAVTAGQNPLRAVLADPQYTEVPTGSLAETSQRVTEAIHQSGFGVGADLEIALDRLSGSADFTIVITDGMPGPRRHPRNHPASWMVLSSSIHRSAGFLGSVIEPPPAGLDARTFLDENPHLIDKAVTELIEPLQRWVATQ